MGRLSSGLGPVGLGVDPEGVETEAGVDEAGVPMFTVVLIVHCW
jgi:hypothetical protein